MLRRAGAENKSVVFLFSDTQIKDESFLEDINNILNSGEVPNMFPQDERMQVGGRESAPWRHHPLWRHLAARAGCCDQSMHGIR